MRNVIIGIMILLIIGAIAYFTLSGQSGEEGFSGSGEQATTLAEDLPVVQASDSVVAEAEVVPVSDVSVRFEVGGTVDEVLVEEGDRVDRDQPLVRLDTRDLVLRVEDAQAQLAQRRAELEQLLDGATPDSVDASRAAVANAEALVSDAEANIARQQAEVARDEAEVARSSADLQRVQANVTQEDITAARARVDQRRAELADLEAGADPVDIAQAQADVDVARADLQQTRDSLSAAKTEAEAEVEVAANDLRDAQANYDRVYWEVREIERDLNDVDQEIWQEQKDREEQALRAVQDAEQRLEQARIRLEEARQNEITSIQQSEARLREAEVILEDVRAGAEPEQVARARADVADAEAQLAILVGARRQAEIAAAQAGIASSQANVAASAADVSSAQASLEQAQAQLEQRRAELEDLTAGPRDPEINDREARILQAEVNLRDAELDLEKATLYSPIAGTVVEMNLERGERIEASQEGALVADFSEWEIRTTDLTELGIVRVRVGSEATISFDALPDLRMRGEVSRIQEIGKNEQGDIVYEVTIEPLEWDDRLLWGMTATVSIEPIDGAADSD